MIFILTACLVNSDPKNNADDTTDTTVNTDTAEETGTPDTGDLPLTVTVSIEPETIFNDSELSCEVTNAPTALELQWQVDNQILDTTESNIELSSEIAAPQQTLLCIAKDSSSNAEIGRAEATISNRSPSEPVITVSPLEPRAGRDDVLCEATAEDADGQDLEFVFEWSESTTGASFSEATLSAEHLEEGQEWTCTVTVSDSIETVSSLTAVTVGPRANCVFGACDLAIDLGNDVTMDLNFIQDQADPGGQYTLSHQFYISTTEVTQGMFAALMNYNPLTGNQNHGTGSNHPVYWVSWHMAADYANKVTLNHNALYGTNFQSCYSCSGSSTESPNCTEAVYPYECDGYSLPTVSEWELAARSGTTSEFWTGLGANLGGVNSSNLCDTTVYIDDGLSSPLLSDYAWFCGNSSDSSQPVAQKLANGFGLFDMHGNLFEWTADWDGCDLSVVSLDPYCDIQPNIPKRVSVGGDFEREPNELRSSYRSRGIPGTRYFNSGFRLVRRIF